MRFSTPESDSDEDLNLINLDPIEFDTSASSENYTVMEDYNSIATPERCVADFCLIPIGTPSASVSNEVAAVQRLMRSCGLEYSMHSAGTTVEGSWNDVMEVIGKAHSLVHKNGIARVQTDIRAGSRTDKIQHFSEKVAKVESLLANDSNPNSNNPTNSSTPNPSSSIQPPNSTTQLTSVSAKGPWISASMHLRRSYTPHNSGNENALTTTKSHGWSSPGEHTASIEFRTGVDGINFKYVFCAFLGTVVLRALFVAPAGIRRRMRLFVN